jgi:hypothetical protein
MMMDLQLFRDQMENSGLSVTIIDVIFSAGLIKFRIGHGEANGEHNI